MDSDDDDIFCYTPLQRSSTQLSQTSKLKQEQQSSRLSLSQQVTKSKAKKSQNTAKRGSFKAPSNAPKKKKIKDNSPKKDDTLSVNLQTEVCPVCQMPWVALGIGGKRDVHINKCSAVDYSKKKECPKGFQCQELDEKHYISYSHTLWAETRSQVTEADQEDLLNLDSKMSPNGDSGFGDGAGPSGWKPKSENVNNGTGDTFSSCLSEIGDSQNMANSVKIFDIDDDESLPDIGGLVNNVKNEDISTPMANDKACVEDKTKLFSSSMISPDSGNKEADEQDTPLLFDIVIDDASEHSLDSEETTLYDNNRDRRGVIVRVAKVTDNRSSAKTSTSLCDEDAAGERVCSEHAKITAPTSSTGANINTQATSSDESQSLLKDQDIVYSPVADDQDQNDEESNDHEDHQHPLDDELDPEEYEVLNKLVDDAVDRYLNKANLDSKCFHLHLHYHESPQKSPGKPGQKSILNYFRPLNSSTPPDEGTSNSQCCRSGSAEQIRSETRKSGAGAWKTLMAKMQGRDKQSKADQNTLDAQSQPKQSQPKRQNNYYGGANRRCPFYKYIPDTNFVVDAFCYGYLNGITGYFLSHFHFDHFRGLTCKFNKHIYCSHITAKLVTMRVGVSVQFVRPLPMDEPRVIDGVEVTLLDANHCPGSAMFLFKLPSGSTILHVGDFRAHPKMESYPSLWNCSIDTLYLDTTYCKPIYDFPSQEEVIDKCVSIATMHVEDNSETLIVVGSYTIGKERVFKAIASALNCRIWANNDKQKILRCLEDDEISSRLTSDKLSARVHVVSMATIHQKKLVDYIEQLKPKFNVVVAIRPTGWEHNGDELEVLNNLVPRQCGSVYIYGIPYSEHSSYNELQRFVKFTRPKKIISTVNVGNENSRKAMEKEFKNWLQ